MTLEKITTKTVTFFIENGILYSIYKSDADVHIEDLEINFIERKKLQNGVSMPVLLDVSKVWQFSDNARKFGVNSELVNLTKAMAIVTGKSTSVILLANSFLKLFKPKYPTKLFKSKEKAIKWLNSYK